MLPFNELPQSLLKELCLYVKVNTPNLLEYDFIDIPQNNSHLIWHDSSNWYIANDIHVFKGDTYNYKFDWCYISTDIIISVYEAKTKLKYLKSRYIKEIKTFKEYQQNKRLSNLSDDF